MGRLIRTACVLTVVLLMGTVVPVAASGGSADLSAGYQYQWVPAGGIPAGFNVDVSISILQDLNIVGQFDWSHTSEKGIALSATQTVSTVGGGVRWSSHAKRSVTPFLQALVGASRNLFHDVFTNNNAPSVAGRTFDSGGTSALVQVGGGVAVPLSKKVSAVGQFDDRILFVANTYAAHSWRVVVGGRIVLN